jgi:hypothetical protein
MIGYIHSTGHPMTHLIIRLKIYLDKTIFYLKLMISAQKQNDLSCFIRTIDTKKTFDFSYLFIDYSNYLFSYRWTCSFVVEKNLNISSS